MPATIEDKIYPRESIIDEIKYLRYFYEKVQDSLGPASDDVVDAINRRYTGLVPEKYKYEEEE